MFSKSALQGTGNKTFMGTSSPTTKREFNIIGTSGEGKDKLVGHKD